MYFVTPLSEMKVTTSLVIEVYSRLSMVRLARSDLRPLHPVIRRAESKTKKKQVRPHIVEYTGFLL